MQFLLLLIVLLAGMAGAFFARKLTLPAAIAGGLIGLIIYGGIGWFGIVAMALFFVLGTMATSVGRRTKERLSIAQERGGRRTTGQVLANGGAGGLAGLAAMLFQVHAPVFTLMLAAAFSSATADTLSSELGSIYGKRFYDVLSFKKSERGRDGVISLEGTLLGMAGSTVMAITYAAYFGWSSNLLWIVIAGTIGNLTDSVLGATVERKGLLQNDAVNFLNTVVAALTMLLIA